MNYTPELTEYIKNEYTNNPCRETVDRLSQEIGKSVKSVIGKLSREGVYRREIYKTKTGDDPVTKAEIVETIAESLSIETENLVGLEKAPKQVLKVVARALKSL